MKQNREFKWAWGDIVAKPDARFSGDPSKAARVLRAWRSMKDEYAVKRRSDSSGWRIYEVKNLRTKVWGQMWIRVISST